MAGLLIEAIRYGDSAEVRERLRRVVEELDAGKETRVLMYLEHSIQDARTDASWSRRIAA